MLKPTLLLAIAMLFVTPCAAQPAPQTTGDLPFTFEKGFVVAEATIKRSSVTVHVVLATGAEHSIMDPALLQKYELSASYAADGPVTGRNDKTIDFSIVPAVKVGNSKSRDVPMRFGSMSELSSRLGKEIFAALGADFFEGQIVQFDFKNKVIRFLDKTPDDVANTNASSQSAVLKMAPKADDPFRKTYLLPVVEEVQLNGQKLKVLMDTGIASSVALSASAAKKMGFLVPIENGPAREEKVTLNLKSQELKDVSVWIYPKGSGPDQKLSKYGAAAGSNFLQNFIALFDYRKGLVVLEPF